MRRSSSTSSRKRKSSSLGPGPPVTCNGGGDMASLTANNNNDKVGDITLTDSVSWIQDVKPHYEAFNFCVLSPSLTPKVGFNFFLSLNKRGFRADKSGNISGTLNFSLLNSFTAKNMKFLTWAQFDLGNDGSWCNSCLHYWPTASL